jgi:hypothetical protein
MPPLLLDDEEAVAVAVGLRTAAGGAIAGIEDAALRALAKLEQVLPSRLRSRIGTLQSVITPVPVPERRLWTRTCSQRSPRHAGHGSGCGSGTSRMTGREATARRSRTSS